MPAAFHELVVEGPRGLAVGYIEGFVRAKAPDATVLYAENEGFDVETLRERIRDMLHPGREWCHILVPADVVPLVQEAIAAAESNGLELVVRADRAIAKARFKFSFRVYARDVAARIRKFEERLPAGVTYSADTEICEIIDPSAAGVEAYAPAHEYEFRGDGEIHGPVDGVLEVHRMYGDEDHVDLGKIRLEEA